MPAAFPKEASDALAALIAKTDSSTGYIADLEALITRFFGAMNVFGTSATADTGAGEGDVPVLDADGRLGAGQLPRSPAFQHPTGEVPFDAAVTVLATLGLVQAWIRFALTPSRALYAAPAGEGIPATSAGSGYALTAPLASYERLRLDIVDPGAALSAARSVTVANPLADDTWRVADGAVEYRQRSGGGFAQTLDLRAGATVGYRLVGISGSNPDLGLVEGVRAVAASEGNAGVIEIATQDEVGLGTDARKAVTPATLAKALEAYAPLESPALTGRPTAPTPARPAAST